MSTPISGKQESEDKAQIEKKKSREKRRDNQCGGMRVIPFVVFSFYHYFLFLQPRPRKKEGEKEGESTPTRSQSNGVQTNVEAVQIAPTNTHRKKKKMSLLNSVAVYFFFNDLATFFFFFFFLKAHASQLGKE
jgi:hypothetical protein